jgi:hypothetical protein
VRLQAIEVRPMRKKSAGVLAFVVAPLTNEGGLFEALLVARALHGLSAASRSLLFGSSPSRR